MKSSTKTKSKLTNQACCGIWLVVLFFLAVPFFTFSVHAQQEISSTPYEYSLTIDDIVCLGNSQVDCKFITNKYYQKIGDQLNPDEIEEAKLRLGSLNHFTQVSVHLRKGSQRGHVIVVFEVVEADSLQYEFNTFLESYNREENRCNSLNSPQGNIDVASDGTDVDKREFLARLTDYNAFGNGKQLSLTFVKQTRSVNNNNITRPDNNIPVFDFLFGQCITDFALDRYESQQFSTSVEYYDPHFLNSKKLFFITQFEYNQFDSDFNYFDFSTAAPPTEIEQSYSNNESYLAAAIGTRFANYSFFSISAQSYLDESEMGLGFAYGWNSQDDVLFPTTGSFFKIQQGIERDGSKTIDINFQKNHLLTDSLIFSWGVGDGFLNSSSHQLGSIGSDFSASKSDNVLFAKIGGVVFKNDTKGVISGWNLGVIAEDRKGLGVMANYIYHTDKLILNLGLNFYPGTEGD